MTYNTPTTVDGSCFICGAADPAFTIMFTCRLDLFLQTDLLLPAGAKCCKTHINYTEDGFRTGSLVLQLKTQEGVIGMTTQQTYRRQASFGRVGQLLYIVGWAQHESYENVGRMIACNYCNDFFKTWQLQD